MFLHPDDDQFDCALTDTNWLDYKGVAVRMVGDLPQKRDEFPTVLSRSQINRLRLFLDTTRIPLLLFGPFDTGVGQIVLSRLTIKRYTGLKQRIADRLTSLARPIDLRAIPRVMQREASRLGISESVNASQAALMKAFAMLEDLGNGSPDVVPANRAPVRIEPFIPAYALGFDKLYLQNMHERIPSVTSSRRYVRERHLRALALKQGLDFATLLDCVERPAFRAQDFFDFYTPDDRFLAKMVRNAKGGLDCRRASLKLTLARVTEGLTRKLKGLGFYSSTLRTEFTLLVLLRPGEAWEDIFTPSPRLTEIYQKLRGLFGFPGLIFRDRNGLAVSWPLQEEVPDSNRLVAAIETKLALIQKSLAPGEQIQIRPQTANQAKSALLIPDASCLVDRDRLLPVQYVHAHPVSADPVDLFGSDVLLVPPQAPKSKVQHQLDMGDNKLIKNIVAACPGSQLDKNRLTRFLRSLIPFLRDLEKDPSQNHCGAKGSNVYTVESNMLTKWGYRNQAMREWLSVMKIFHSDRAYTPGGECINPKTKCHKFNWHPVLPADPRHQLLRSRSVSELIRLCGVRRREVQNYRNDPSSMPLRRYLLLSNALQQGHGP